MNVFVTDLIVDNVVTHMQGFSSGILIIFFEKLSVKCEGIWINVWLLCMVNVQFFVRSTRKCKDSNKYFFHKLSEMWKFQCYQFQMPPFLQFILFEKLCQI